MPPLKKLPKNSVHRALNALGDRWGLLIVQEAFIGISQFKDFQSKTGMARSTLANRLRALVKNGIMELRSQRPGMARQTYHLTTLGSGLFDSVMLAWGWGVTWGVANRNMPTALIHTTCGKPMVPQMRCGQCKGPISLTACRYKDGPGAGLGRVQFQRLHRRRSTEGKVHAADVVDFTGDRWTAMVIATQYFGIHRFDDIQNYLGIATNILADRLRALEAAGVLERRIYELVPPRYEYWLTKKGIDTYPHSLSLMFWGDRWLAGEKASPVHVIHKACGHRLGAVVVCSACQRPLKVDSVKAGRFRKLSPS